MIAAAGAAAGWMTSRGVVFSALLAVAFANYASVEATQAVLRHGLAIALLGGFGVSAILWIAQGVAVAAVLGHDAATRLDRADVAVALAAALLIAAPVPQAAMVAQTLLAAWLFLRGDPETVRAAALAGVATLPALWGPLILAVFADAVLAVDAILVAALTMAETAGNTVVMADGAALKIARACSSLSNISLALLCWALFVHIHDRRYGPYRFQWAAVVAAPVVAINVVRMAAIAWRPEHYDLIHGDMGNAVFGAATLAAIVGVCLVGVQREDDRLCRPARGARRV